MEKNRIYHAALGSIITVLLAVSISGAQESSPDSLYKTEPAEAGADTLTGGAKPDSILKKTDNIFMQKAAGATSESDSSRADEFPAEVESTHTETINPTSYYERKFMSRGVADDLKDLNGVFIGSLGPTGSPQIPFAYLNVPGVELLVNDHPYLYNDIYRPYKIGSDLNSLPWEILNSAHWNDERSLDNRIHLDLGRPPDDENRSDVEVFRGPYSYNANRWRFFRPFGSKTYGYFTLGFKKSSGYLQNSDYDGYHVAGGGSRVVKGGLLKIDLWKYRAKSGVNSYDFVTPQLQRHSRTTHRYEISYFRKFEPVFDFRLSGMYQKNGLIVKDTGDTLSIDNDIGGGTVSGGRELPVGRIDLGMNYYRLRTFKLEHIEPGINIFDYYGKLSKDGNRLSYRGEMKYSWNGADHGDFLPAAFLSYEFSRFINPFALFSRTRRIPDLNLLYFNEEIDNLEQGDFLSSYNFESSPHLKSPVTSKYTIGNKSDMGPLRWRAGISYIRIKNQVYLSYLVEEGGIYTVKPVNFDDEYIEIDGSLNFKYGIVDCEAGGAIRSWKDRYFADGLEKGPSALGFGRLSLLKSFFFDDLFLGGSLEFRGSTRQDYRSLSAGLTDWFGVVNGRLEFNYKDFIFWWNEDNLINSGYTTWWPYPETARTLWWGFRWRFYD